MQDSQEPGAPLVDVGETLALLVAPALVVGVVGAAVGGVGEFAPGLAVGGLFGAVLAGLRRGFRAVRTPDGVERRLRSASDDPEGNPWVRLANVEYDERYDRVLAVGLALVGVGAFAAVPSVADDGSLVVVRLLAVGLFGVTASLLVVGLSRS